MARRASALVVVLTRAPVAGRVKTRLAARLGAAGAAHVQRRLVAAALNAACAARCGPVELHATACHGWLSHLAKANCVALRPQRGSALGERMAHAARSALRRAPYVLLTGSDCPDYAPRDFERARRWLAGGADVVLAPALDGGYAMIGLRRAADFLFADMPWGSERVYAETVRRINAAGWRLRVLPALGDVDRPEDLARIDTLRFAARARRRQKLSAL